MSDTMTQQDYRRLVRERKEALGLSDYRLGKLTGIAPQTIGRYLHGHNDLTGDRLSRIAAALNLELRPK